MWKVIQGNNIDTLKEYPDNHFDSVVTDPPYGIAFLGKDWDSKKATETTSKLVALSNLPSGMKHTSLADDLEFQYWMRDIFLECNRVLKPGGHLLAFSAARTYHHMAMAAQTAGFEIRDQLMWLYGSGFPKAQDIGKAIERREGKRNNNALGIKRSVNESGPKTYCPKCNLSLNGSNEKKCKDETCPLRDEIKPADNEWAGWKTALKPAHEPIVMARKPFKGSTIDNVLEWGTGALNIDESRIPAQDKSKFPEGEYTTDTTVGSIRPTTRTADENSDSRFPSNVLGEVEGYQKFFYCPKVSRAERHAGFDVKIENTRPRGEAFGDGNILTDAIQNTGNNIKTEDKKGNGIDRVCETCGASILKPQDCHCETKSWIRPIKSGNNHPTVKPVELMKYLIKLVTPKGGKVLDPFNGSGSTGMAAVELGYDYVGCELDPDYVEIANKRISAWEKRFDTPAHNLFDVDE